VQADVATAWQRGPDVRGTVASGTGGRQIE
jgi:hypothetical protein